MKSSRHGFSLVEVLVASVISVVVVGLAIGAFVNHRKAYRRQELRNLMQQNTRMTYERLARDIKTAGYGIPLTNVSDFPLWVDWVPGITVSNRICIQQGPGNTPDKLTLVGAFEEPLSRLSQAVAPGDTVLNLVPGTSFQFNQVSRKVIFIGRYELARIVAVSGNQLLISTHSSVLGDGLEYAYPAGTPIELVEAVTYSCVPDMGAFPFRPLIQRDNNASTFTNPLQKMLAFDIDDLQVTDFTNCVEVEIRCRAAETDVDYTHPELGDNYRRFTLTSRARSRNVN